MTERVDRFTPYLHEDWRGMIGVTASMRSTTNGEYVRVEVYQSQAARIAELEAENAILRTEKYADAEAIASARNDALREAADRIDRKIRAIQPEMTRRAQRLAAGKKPGFQYAIHRADLDARMSDRDAILAMIEGDTND